MPIPEIPPFGYGYDGALLVTSDGPELLVCAGPDEGPMWRRTLDATVVGVGVTDGAVVAVDAGGTLVVCDRDSGEVKSTLALERLATGLAAAPSGIVAVLGASSVNVVHAAGTGARREIDVADAATLALDAAGKRVAVGSADGTVRVFDAGSGKERGSSKVPAPAKGIAWSPRGYWIVASGSGLCRVSADGSDTRGLVNTEDLVLSSVAVSEDGSIVAVRVGDQKVGLFDLLDFKFQGVIQYPERTVGQVSFGPGSWLGVGLDLGDGNKVDLLTGAVHRTDPHEGRVRNRWVLIADPKTDAIAKVMSRVKKDPSALDGKGEAPKKRAPVDLRAPEPPPSTNTNMAAVIGVILMAIYLLIRLLK
jgi:WD40 repeat protein